MSNDRQQNQTPETKPERRGAKYERGVKIDEIFRSKWKTLIALFPDKGPERATRARNTALLVSNGLKTKDDGVTAESISEAALACHSLGLDVGDQAYIYPFKNQAKLVVGPRGLIALAYRGGFLASIAARSVFEGDDFDYNLGTNEITHRKATDSRRPFVQDERGDWRAVPVEDLITHAYCLIKTTTDGQILEVLTSEDIAFYRRFSQATTGPWFDNYEGMARKTVIKRGLEFVPRDAMLSAALKEQSDGSFAVPEEIMEAVEKKLRAERTAKGAGALREAMGEERADSEPPPEQEPARGQPGDTAGAVA